jgi:hypothetical protein
MMDWLVTLPKALSLTIPSTVIPLILHKPFIHLLHTRVVPKSELG